MKTIDSHWEQSKWHYDIITCIQYIALMFYVALTQRYADISWQYSSSSTNNCCVLELEVIVQQESNLSSLLLVTTDSAGASYPYVRVRLLSYKSNFQLVNKHTGGKWLIDGTRHNKHNQSQIREFPCGITYISAPLPILMIPGLTFWFVCHRGVQDSAFYKICTQFFVFLSCSGHIYQRHTFYWLCF